METPAASALPLVLIGQLAETPWPKDRHDAQNTGLSQYTGPNKPNVVCKLEPGKLEPGTETCLRRTGRCSTSVDRLSVMVKRKMSAARTWR
ncbi:MAG: hypothetical protein HY897_25250 [Deltaproteobacteria bacterium]|nr:hypothetical protein [Deltaproteobacteria bacterium]